MTDSPKADKWMTDYGIGGGSLKDAVTAAGAPFLVYRHKQTQIDYLWAPGLFHLIASPDEYFFLAYGKLINTPHDAAPQVETNYLEFLQWVARLTATAPGAVSDIIYPGAAPAENEPRTWLGGFEPDEDTLRAVREWAAANGIASNASAE